jgi:hypothetical protein
MGLNEKVVIVLNERIEAGRLLNAAAHLALGYGASRGDSGQTELHLLNYVDASGEPHPNISALSLIVLKATPGQLRALWQRAYSEGIARMSFTDTMTEGSYDEQLDRTRSTPSDQLIYIGVLLFGTRERLDPLTRKFSLFRAFAAPGNGAL